MLDFNATITGALERRSSKSLYLIRLYYGDESAFTGISSVDFTDGSDFYRGVVSSVGSIQDTLDLFSFRVNQANVNISVVNTKAFDSNKRFSDLVGTNAYDGRKCEIYVIPNVDIGNIDKEQIFSGIITADFSYDQRQCSIYVNNYKQKFDISLPQTIIRQDDTSNDFHYAPEQNFNKPIPMLYGSFIPDSGYAYNPGASTSVLNEPATDRFGSTRHLAPAVVVNEFDTSSNKTIAKADTAAIKSMNARRAFLFQSGIYSNIEFKTVSSVDTVTVAEATAAVSFNFADKNAYAIIPLIPAAGQDSSFTRDRHSTTVLSTATTTQNQPNELYTLGIGDVSSLGTLASTNPVRIFLVGSVTGNVVDVQIEINDSAATTEVAYGGGTPTRGSILGHSDETKNVANFGSGASSWQFAQDVKFLVTPGSSNSTLNIDAAFLQVEYTPNEAKSFVGTVKETKTYNVGPYEFSVKDVDVEKDFSFPSNAQVIFISATGRKYGSWIDGSRGSPGNNKNENDLIEHPAHIIEDILRTEMGLADANIDMTSFDTVYNLATSTVAHFSQINQVGGFDLIDDICRQFGFYFFFSGEGKATLVPRKLASAYNPSSLSPDITISFNDCIFKGISKTDVGNVYTKVRLEYDYDYGNRKNQMNITTSSTNKGDYNRGKDIELITSCDKIWYVNAADRNETSAKSFAQAAHDLYLDLYKTRKNVIKLTSYNLTHLKLEVGDIAAISDEPEEITLYGTAITNQNFMITKTMKYPDKIELELTQVS